MPDLPNYMQPLLKNAEKQRHRIIMFFFLESAGGRI